MCVILIPRYQEQVEFSVYAQRIRIICTGLYSIYFPLKVNCQFGLVFLAFTYLFKNRN